MATASSSSSLSSPTSCVPLITCRTRCNLSPDVRFEWILYDFESLFETLGATAGRHRELLSDRFTLPGSGAATTSNTFQMKCARNDDDENLSDTGDFLSVYLLMPTLTEDTKLTYIVGIKDKNGVLEDKLETFGKIFEVGRRGWGWPKAFSLTDLQENSDNLLPEGNLTLALELTVQKTIVITKTDHQEFGDAKTLTEELSELLRIHPETADVTLACRDKEFPCHKTVLSARSPVFRAMFAHAGFEEDTSGRVLVEDFTPEVVEALVKAVYSEDIGKLIKGFGVDYGGDLVCDLFRAAEKYEIDSLKVACEKALVASLDLENCARIMHWAMACRGDTLARVTRKFIQDNVTKIISTVAFRDLVAAFPDAMLSPSTTRKDKDGKKRGVGGERDKSAKKRKK